MADQNEIDIKAILATNNLYKVLNVDKNVEQN